MNGTNRGGAPSPSLSDIEFEQLWIWWMEEYGIQDPQARWLALFQYCGGNAFGLVDLDGEISYAPRGVV